ncbi:MAG: LysM peptidoglycan-binding domain-containing protein [Clostridiales bacterium]|nr:LysM peptidoglycan-binding domain-containing protein [Clostridiales bacterium]
MVIIMENNAKNISELGEIFSRAVDVDLDFQESLMSYCDDMLKIVRCCVNNFVVSTDYKNNSLTVYGKSKIYLTYISDSSASLTTADFEEDFQKTIAIDGGFDNVSTEIEIEERYCNFRVINQRRIDIHSSFSLGIKAYARLSVKTAAPSGSDILLKCEDLSYFSCRGTAYAKAEFEEESAVAADSAVIKKIVNSFYSCFTDEVKIIKDKMLVKTTVSMSFLYTEDNEDENIKRCEKEFTVSKIIDVDGIDDGDMPIVKANVGNLYVKPKADLNNELRYIEILGDINISAAIYRKADIQIATDAYSIDGETVNSYAGFTLNVNGEFSRNSVSDTAAFTFDSVKIAEVLDLSFSLNGKNTLAVSAFILNENGELSFVSQKKETEPFDFTSGAVGVKSFDFVIKSENSIDVRYTLEYNFIKYEKQNFNVLESVVKTDKKLPESPALVVYFASEQEQLWDIAKKFRSSPDLIRAQNELTSNTITSKRILLIPGM